MSRNIAFLAGMTMLALDSCANEAPFTGCAGHDTIEIAKGVCMPLVNFGGYYSRPSNYHQWLDLGGRGVDTAWVYNNQDLVGRAVVDSHIPRSDLFITTKVPCCPTSMVPWCSDWGYNSPGEMVKRSAEDNLQQLGLEFVDLMLLHWPCQSPSDTAQAYAALEEVQKAGKARAIGISNFNQSLIDRLMESARVKPAVNQCGFSIPGHILDPLVQDPQSSGQDPQTRHRCRELDITYSAYSPLGGFSINNVLQDPDVVAIATVHNKTSAQVALRWVVQQGVPAVTASSDEDHSKADLDIFDFKLADEEMEWLSAKSSMLNLARHLRHHHHKHHQRRHHFRRVKLAK